MRVAVAVLVLGILVVVAYAADVPVWWDIDDARLASKIEIKMGRLGGIEDVEYHVPTDRVPPAVHAAMGKLRPGLTPIAAEKEFEAGVLYYELTVVLSGNKKAEAMFTPAGVLHSQEIETAIDDPDYPVPQEVQDTVTDKYPDGTDVIWEVILDADGGVVEFHVKLTEDKGTADEKHYKLIVMPGGFLEGAYLEVVAELEVPAAPR